MTIKINNKEITNEEFDKLKEDLSKNKSKKIVEIEKNVYKVLEKMNG